MSPTFRRHRPGQLPAWIEVIFNFVPEAGFGSRGPQWRTIFGQSHSLEPFPAPDPQHLAGLVWHHALHARICIERGRWWQAGYWLSGVRDQVIALACVRLGYPGVHAKGAHRCRMSWSRHCRQRSSARWMNRSCAAPSAPSSTLRHKNSNNSIPPWPYAYIPCPGTSPGTNGRLTQLYRLPSGRAGYPLARLVRSWSVGADQPPDSVGPNETSPSQPPATGQLTGWLRRLRATAASSALS